jgi:hypothetical protein
VCILIILAIYHLFYLESQHNCTLSYICIFISFYIFYSTDEHLMPFGGENQSTRRISRKSVMDCEIVSENHVQPK